VDDFCDSARNVATGYGQFIHTGRVHSHPAGHCASRVIAQDYFGTPRSVVNQPIRVVQDRGEGEENEA
jgi:hypothetical protein